MKQFMSNNYLDIARIIETNRFYIVRYRYKQSYLALIDKDSHKSFLINLKFGNNNYNDGIENDIDGGHFLIPGYYFTENFREYIVGLIYPRQIKTRVASKEFKELTPLYPEKKKELESLADNLKEDDNPVLMLVRLKQ